MVVLLALTAASVINVGCPRLSAKDFSAMARPILPFPSSKG
jgi:diphthamide synthase subunit DPH2